MATVNVRESLRKLDEDTSYKYDLLTMYDSCPLLDNDKKIIARMLYDKEDPEVIYDRLQLYLDDNIVSDLDTILDIDTLSKGKYESFINHCVDKLAEIYDYVQYNEDIDAIQITQGDKIRNIKVNVFVNNKLDDYQVAIDECNYDIQTFDSENDAIDYVVSIVNRRMNDTDEGSIDDEIDCCSIYDVVENNGELTAKGIIESTNELKDIDLGKINTAQANELLNNILNNPNYKVSADTISKINNNSAPWGLAVQMVGSVDVDATNGLLAVGDVGGDMSVAESVDKSLNKGSKVTDGRRNGTVLDYDSEMVLVDWDYSDTDAIEWIDKKKLDLCESANESIYDIETKTNARKLVDKAKSEGKKLSMKDAEEVVDQSFNKKCDNIDDFYKTLDLSESAVSGRYVWFDYDDIKDVKPAPQQIIDAYNVKYPDYSDPLVDIQQIDFTHRNYAEKELHYLVTDNQGNKFYAIVGNVPESKLGQILEAHEDDLDPKQLSFKDLMKRYKNYTTFKDIEENSGLIRDLCDDLENKEVSYSIYHHKKDNGMTIFYDDFELVEVLTPYKKEEFKKQLQDELYDKFIDLARTPEWGFENLAEIGDYLIPTIEVNDYEGEYDNDIEVEFRAEVNYREMEDVCNTLDKVVMKYDKNAYFEPVQPGIAVAYLKFPKKLKEDFEDDEIVTGEQEFDSAATSINSNRLPAVYSMVDFTPGQVVIDFGGGKFDNAVNYLKDKDVTLLVYDPYNRSAEHNKEVLRVIRENGGADAAINSNVLNVIKEPEARQQVLKNIKKLVKPGAPIYITVYEGTGKGNEGPTKSGYQLNRKTSDYIDEISQVFSNVNRKGKLITAINESFTKDDIDTVLNRLGGVDKVKARIRDTRRAYPGIEDDELVDMLWNEGEREEWESAVKYLSEATAAVKDDDNDVLSGEEKMNIAKSEMDKVNPKSVKSSKDATFKNDGRLSTTSERYKGYLIVLDRGGDGYNVYDKHRELEDAGYPSREAAKNFIDELVAIEEAVETEDTPYTYSQVFDELKSLTRNFTVKSDTLKCGFKEEAEFSQKILSRYYSSVEVDRVGSWFEVEFKDRLKHTNESLHEEWNREWDNIGIEIEKAARKEHIWVDFINTDSLVMGAFTATFEINNGDWKHDHLAFNEVVEEYLANNEKYALWKIDTNQTDSSDDDSYSAEHIAFIVPKDKMELLNSMKGLFAESVNPVDLTDCPACGDFSFDSKGGKCTKCNCTEELHESKSIAIKGV